MSKRFIYGPHGEYKGHTSSTSPNAGCGLLMLGLVCVAFLDKALPLLAIAGIGWVLWWWFVDRPRNEKRDAVRKDEQLKQEALQQQERQEFADRMERNRQELERLRSMPTSSSGTIYGRRIARQIRMISVDNHRTQDEADLAFLHQVESVGGDAAINRRVRHHGRGGCYISIQGDAVKLG